jgi:hypothetical protein
MDTTRIDDVEGTLMAKFPSKSVGTPVVVPLIKTLAPGSGELSVAEVTLPVMLIPCANDSVVMHAKMINKYSDRTFAFIGF